MTDPWSWPKEPVVIKRFVVDDFNEGAFLRMLLDKMSHLLEQVDIHEAPAKSSKLCSMELTILFLVLICS